MSRYKKIELTPAKLEKIKQEAVEQTLLLTIGYLMDELNYDADRCVDVWAGITRYAMAVKDKTISMQKVCDIINANVDNINVRWNK